MLYRVICSITVVVCIDVCIERSLYMCNDIFHAVCIDDVCIDISNDVFNDVCIYACYIVLSYLMSNVIL